MRAAVLLLLVMLAGCAGAPARVPAQCDAMCFQGCVGQDEDTGVRVTADPAASATWDQIGEDVVGKLAGKLRSCDVRRDACVQCLRRLDRRRVIAL